MKFPKLLSLAFVLSGLMAAPAEANLIANGSFEDPVFSSSSSCGPFNDCLGYLVGDDIGGWFSGSPTGGWFVIGKSGAPGTSVVMLLDSNYDETDGNSGAVLNFHAQDGFHSIDLTGEGNQGLTNGVKQSIDSIAGHKYEISFEVGNQYDGAEGYETGSSVGFYIDGNFVGAYSHDDNTLEDVTWKQFTLDFIAAGPLTTLAFLNNTDVGDNFAGLDNVVVNDLGAVVLPEPGTLALFGLGLGVLFLRRRKPAPI